MSYVTLGEGIETSTEVKEIASALVKCTGYPTIGGEQKTAPGHSAISFRKPSEVEKDQKSITGIQLCAACSTAFHDDRRQLKRTDKELSYLCKQIQDVKGYLDKPNVDDYELPEEQLSLLRGELKVALETLYSLVEPKRVRELLAEMKLDVEYAQQLGVELQS